MNEHFVPYEISLKLKELGFKERCLAGYLRGEFYWEGISNKTLGEPWTDICKAPLWQQVIDWFLDKYQLCIYWKPDRPNIGDTEYFIEHQFEDGIIAHEIHMFSYDAREQAILKAIELCQNKK